MAELGFQDQSMLRFGLGIRDASPDSVIFTQESNFSLFSSASASVDRCSFASDVHDHESLASEISLVISILFFLLSFLKLVPGNTLHEDGLHSLNFLNFFFFLVECDELEKCKRFK